MFGFVGASSFKYALHVDLPLFVLATQVYSPWSVSLLSSVIVSVPLCDKFDRSFNTNGMPSLYHAMVIMGPPMVLHGRVATDLIGNVWLAGP